jgi:hypothetical protein
MGPETEVSMKWVTKNYVHLDRVACPWLIRRFIDPEAEFTFVGWDVPLQALPAGAIPFAIAGAELGPHDASGPTFQKILDKYQLDDPALRRIALVIKAGVDYVLHDYHPPAEDTHGQIAVGLLAVSEGLMLTNLADPKILDASFPVYDALYANFKAHALVEAKGLSMPPTTGRGPGEKTEFLRMLLKSAAP